MDWYFVPTFDVGSSLCDVMSTAVRAGGVAPRYASHEARASSYTTRPKVLVA